MVNSMFDGELTPAPGPALFGIVQDPLGALGELFFGHPQAGTSGVSTTSMTSMQVFWEKTCWLRKNWRIYGLLQIWKRTGPKLWLS